MLVIAALTVGAFRERSMLTTRRDSELRTRGGTIPSVGVGSKDRTLNRVNRSGDVRLVAALSNVDLSNVGIVTVRDKELVLGIVWHDPIGWLGGGGIDPSCMDSVVDSRKPLDVPSPIGGDDPIDDSVAKDRMIGCLRCLVRRIGADASRSHFSFLAAYTVGPKGGA